MLDELPKHREYYMRVFPRLHSKELYKQLERSEKQIFEACARFGPGISTGFEDVLRGYRSTDSK